MSSPCQPLRIAVVNEPPLIVAGLKRLLADHADKVTVIELEVLLPEATIVDVVLYDAFLDRREAGPVLDDLVRHHPGKALVFTWHPDPHDVQAVLSTGTVAYLPKCSTAEQIVAAIEALVRGEINVFDAQEELSATTARDRPAGARARQTKREVEILTLIAQGRTNNEVADHAHLSINSVKTYIRQAYRKIGVTRRSQAVRWCLENGLVTPLRQGRVTGVRVGSGPPVA